MPGHEQSAPALATVGSAGLSTRAKDTAPWKQVGRLGMRRFVVVDAVWANDPAVLRQAARAVCSGTEACVVMFWTDAAKVPGSMPMSGQEKRAVVAQYLANPRSGAEELLLRCQPDGVAGTRCLP